MRIRDPKWKKIGSGIWNGKNLDLGWKNSDPGSGKNIPDPQHCFKASLMVLSPYQWEMIRCLYKQANKVRGQLNKWKNPYCKYIDSGLRPSMVYFTRQDIMFSLYLCENRFLQIFRMRRW